MAWAYKILARGGKLLTTGGKAVVLTPANESAVEACCCGPSTCCQVFATPPQTVTLTIDLPTGHATFDDDYNCTWSNDGGFIGKTWALQYQGAGSNEWLYDDGTEMAQIIWTPGQTQLVIYYLAGPSRDDYAGGMDWVQCDPANPGLPSSGRTGCWALVPDPVFCPPPPGGMPASQGAKIAWQ